MEKQIRRVIFTCGGTAGHVNPAIAVAQLVAEKNPGVEILFVGAERGLEKELVPAAGMNANMADMLVLEAAKEPFHHIHGAGKAGYPKVLSALREKGVDPAAHPALQVREYIYDMAPVMRAADLVICRAGASTVSELTALGIPAILVPSPYVTNNHQEKNARALEAGGGAEVLLEKDASGRALFQQAARLLREDERRTAMGAAMAALGVRDAAARIYDTVQSILKT